MTITVIYRVSVDIDEQVFRNHGESPEYERATLRATEGALSAGSNSYSNVEEWAEFHSLEEAKQCEAALTKVASGYFN